MSLAIAIVIAGAIAFWVYSDARNLDHRGIRVLKWSPVAWGWLVFLFALLFGILYLVNRPKAIAGAGAPPARPDYEPEPEPEPDLPRRFCPACGTQIVRYASYCHGCGREVERISQ
jgi:hypothetical protein